MMDRVLRTLGCGLIRLLLLQGAARGQVIVMFAVVSVSLIGMMGLAIDGGFYLYARRTTQAAADAAALAGARQLSKSTAAQAEAVAVAAANGQGGVNPTVVECQYVNDNNTPIPDEETCGKPPVSASGVRVRTAATVPTFFLNVIPGAPKEVVTNGQATARVQLWAGTPPTNAPFIMCGSFAWAVEKPDGTTPSQAIVNILDGNGRVKSEFVGYKFRVHDEKIGNNDPAKASDCGAQGASFNGWADPSENADKTTPDWFEYVTGNKIGQVEVRMPGAAGCRGSADDGCVMYLPVAISPPPPGSPAPPKKSNPLYVTTVAAFLIERLPDDRHNATLLENYIVIDEGRDGWNQGTFGDVVIRLTG